MLLRIPSAYQLFCGSVTCAFCSNKVRKVFFRSIPKSDVENVQTITSENDVSWNTLLVKKKKGVEREDVFIESVCLSSKCAPLS